MNKLRLAGIVWLIFLFAFFLGMYVSIAKLWPYGPLRDLKHFVLGHPAENLTLAQKIKNDFNFSPDRHIKKMGESDGLKVAYYNSFSSKHQKTLEGLILNPRRSKPLIYLSNSAPKGYRVMQGVFDFKDYLHGAIMLDPQGKVVHEWHFNTEGIAWEHNNDPNIFPHGFEIGRDGSVITAYDAGKSLTKYDYCSNVVWRLQGYYHHCITFDGPDAVWVNFGTDVDNLQARKIDYNTGKIIKSIKYIDIMKANPDIDILGSMQEDSAIGSKWYPDNWHPNDIDPLPQSLARHYPKFKAGDLLVSMRTPNLVFVVDPDTLKVKWWIQGLTRRQHDPDWNNRGTITIYNNNMHRHFSNIVEIDPSTNEYKIVVPGQKYSFYSWWRGKHQPLPNGGYLITVPDTGRVFEVNANGEVTFDFLNTYTDDAKELLAIGEARFLPTDYFGELPECAK